MLHGWFIMAINSKRESDMLVHVDVFFNGTSFIVSWVLAGGGEFIFFFVFASEMLWMDHEWKEGLRRFKEVFKKGSAGCKFLTILANFCQTSFLELFCFRQSSNCLDAQNSP